MRTTASTTILLNASKTSANLLPASGHGIKASLPRGSFGGRLVLFECLSHARSGAGQFNTGDMEMLSFGSTYDNLARVLGSTRNGSS